MVDRVLIAPPMSRIGPATDDERNAVIAESPLGDYYDKEIDRESAYEILLKRAEAEITHEDDEEEPEKKRGRKPDTLMDTILKSAGRSMGRSIGRKIVRGLLGSLFR